MTDTKPLCLEWQPIETAPKDGTEVLVWGQFAGEISGPHSEFDYGIACWDGGHTDFPGYHWSAVGGDAYAVWCNPTHWMPLPEAPSTSDREVGV